MWHVWGRVEVHIGFWWGWEPDGRRLLERYSLRWKDNIKMYIQEVGLGRHGLD